MCARCARVRASARVACARTGVDGFIFPAAAWLARALGFDKKRRGLRRATRVRTGSPPLSGRNKLISNISRVGGCGRSARAASCADEDDDGESSQFATDARDLNPQFTYNTDFYTIYMLCEVVGASGGCRRSSPRDASRDASRAPRRRHADTTTRVLSKIYHYTAMVVKMTTRWRPKPRFRSIAAQRITRQRARQSYGTRTRSRRTWRRNATAPCLLRAPPGCR